MNSIWQSLFFNLAVVSIILVAWDYVSAWVEKQGLSDRWRSSLLGVLLAAGAVASMTMATPLLSGFIFDLRSPLIAAAAYFGGVPAAIATVVISASYRLYLGGSGAVPGVIGIVIVAGIGLGFWRYANTHRKTSLQIVSFGLATALGSVLSFLAFPADARWTLLSETAVPLASLVFISATVIGILLHRELRAQEFEHVNRLYRAMVDELPDCLNVKDVNGRFIIANPATAGLMRSRSTEALLGKTDFDFYPRELADQFRKAETDMLQSDAVHRFEQPALFADGTKGWHDTLKAPLKDDSGRVIGIITYNRNITEQKRVAQLKNDFISTVSHELRTPLTSICGSLGLIAGGITGSLPEKAANLHQDRAQQQRAPRPSHQRYSRHGQDRIWAKCPSRSDTMHLRPIIEQAIAASANYRPEQRVQVALLDDAPRAIASIDPDRLHQALINLISNAIKFSPAEEIVSVKLEQLAEGGTRISVADRGRGIPQSFRDRIFDKFEQADTSSTRHEGGTGLGLSIAKAVVERLNGKIGFHDRQGGGTVFHIDLPGAATAAATESSPEESARPHSHRRGRDRCCRGHRGTPRCSRDSPATLPRHVVGAQASRRPQLCRHDTRHQARGQVRP